MIEPKLLSLRSRLLGWNRQTVLAYAALALCVLVLSLSVCSCAGPARPVL
jgi:hypothetical protein